MFFYFVVQVTSFAFWYFAQMAILSLGAIEPGPADETGVQPQWKTFGTKGTPVIPLSIFLALAFLWLALFAND